MIAYLLGSLVKFKAGLWLVPLHGEPHSTYFSVGTLAIVVNINHDNTYKEVTFLINERLYCVCFSEGLEYCLEMIFQRAIYY